MRITQEADYALRIVCHLAQRGDTVGARTLSEILAVPPSFALKILRKLSHEGIVQGTRGAEGGYTMAADPDTVTVRRVIEAIDGRVEISRCLSDSHGCLYNPDKSCCRFHHVFEELNRLLTERLDRLTIGMMADGSIPLDELLNTIQ